MNLAHLLVFLCLNTPISYPKVPEDMGDATSAPYLTCAEIETAYLQAIRRSRKCVIERPLNDPKCLRLEGEVRALNTLRSQCHYRK